MYREDICRISRSDDGKFIVEVMPPKMQEKMTSKGDCIPCNPDDGMKTYIASTEDELVEIPDFHRRIASDMIGHHFVEPVPSPVGLRRCRQRQPGVQDNRAMK